jgi:capping protein beta
MSEESYTTALSLLRKVNPQRLPQHLTNVSRLNTAISEDLLSTVDIPLAITQDPESGKAFLCCDYNRDLDSFRSPWSNKYYPKLEDDEESPYPSAQLRKLEVALNDGFDVYRDLYYEAGGLSSVYLWDLDEEDSDAGFAGVVLLKKVNSDGGSWDSIHVLEVEGGSGSVEYKVTSTVILELSNGDKQELKLNGNLIRQNSKKLDVDGNDLILSHVVNIGSFVEEIESNLRNLLKFVYFDKTRDIIGELRSIGDLNDVESEKKKQEEVIKGISGI